MPRCRSCPLRFAAELRELQQQLNPGVDLPQHLAGVPPCLHKYEPLFRRAHEADVAAGAQDAVAS